ncbi:MAG: hypothetical protein QM426_10470 [Euryarchaeota archaeon]|nr:hypothetical protein [Euryarchaeota archaeon]
MSEETPRPSDEKTLFMYRLFPLISIEWAGLTGRITTDEDL